MSQSESLCAFWGHQSGAERETGKSQQTEHLRGPQEQMGPERLRVSEQERGCHRSKDGIENQVLVWNQATI